MGLIKTGISIAGKAAAAAASKVISDKVETFIEDEFGTTEKKSGPKKKTKTKNTNLVKCSDCGEFVSIHATTCPHCGCPIIDKKLEKTEKLQERKVVEVVQKEKATKESVKVVEHKKAETYPKEVKVRESVKTLWTYIGLGIAVSVFGGLSAYLGYNAGDHSSGPIITMIVFFSLAVLLALIGAALSIASIKSFYIDEYRIDVWDGVINKVAANNKIMYRGFAKEYELQLPNKSFIKVKFDKASSVVEKIEK